MGKVHGVTDEELANLSDAEREALEEGQEDDAAVAASLKKIADKGGKGNGDEPGPDDDDDDDDDGDDAEAKAAAKAEAEAKAKAEADAKAAAKASEAEEKRRAALTEEARAKEDAAKVEADAKAKAEADAKAKAEAEAKAKKAAAGEEDDGDDAEAQIMRPRLPRHKVVPVEKYDEKMKAIDDAYDAAVAKFTAGDMELTALLAEQRKLDGQRTELRDAKFRADMGDEFNQEAVRAEWLGDVQDFFVKTKQGEGIDYNKPLLNVAFDAALKTLAADKANAEKSTAWFLRAAHKAVKADLGIAPKASETPEEKTAREAAEKAAAAKAAAAKPKGRQPALALVKDVGALPSAGDDDATGGDPEFAAIDKLEGIEYEDALAAMPAAKQEAYLRSR